MSAKGSSQQIRGPYSGTHHKSESAKNDITTGSISYSTTQYRETRLIGRGRPVAQARLCEDISKDRAAPRRGPWVQTTLPLTAFKPNSYRSVARRQSLRLSWQGPALSGAIPASGARPRFVQAHSVCFACGWAGRTRARRPYRLYGRQLRNPCGGASRIALLHGPAPTPADETKSRSIDSCTMRCPMVASFACP